MATQKIINLGDYLRATKHEIKCTLYYYFYIVKYTIYSVFKQENGLNTQKRKVQLLVSLTSYPPRLNTVFLAIESLLNQTFKPDKIILWLSKSEINPGDLPNNLLRLKKRGLEIRFVDENIKSYKKLVYAVEAFKQHHIVTCDDDLMYHNWFLQGLYNAYQKHPNCISAYRARTMRKLNQQQLSSYNDWPLSNSQTPAYNIFATCGGGAWHPPGSLNEQISNRVFMQLSPYGDDIWFKAMGLLNQTKTVLVNSYHVDFPSIHPEKSQIETLWQKNITKNDRQIKSVFDYFKLYELITNYDTTSDGND